MSDIVSKRLSMSRRIATRGRGLERKRVSVKIAGDGDGIDTSTIVKVGATVGRVGVNVGVGSRSEAKVEDVG